MTKSTFEASESSRVTKTVPRKASGNAPIRRLVHSWLTGSGVRIRPVPVFVVLSILIGGLLIAVSPPLRGPDETAHFLRAYGIAQGDVVPSLEDGRGRKGIALSPRLAADFFYFEEIQTGPKPPGTYRRGFEEFLADPPVTAERPAFVPYAGSEGYSPLAYLPQSAAAAIADLLGLDFLPTLYLMRLAGLLTFTALIGWAMTLVPALAWTFFAIAMLPSVLYGRAMISADGGAFTLALIVTALSLHAVARPGAMLEGRQSFWLLLGVLTKPPNLAFLLLPAMTPRWWSAKRWARTGLIILPALVVAMLWSIHSEADTATWRMVEITGHGESAFDPALKLGQLLESPLDLPTAFWATLMQEDYLRGLWRQAIGVLGLFDTVMRDWTYPLLTALLLGTFLVRLPYEKTARRQIAAVAALTILIYGAGLYLIAYLVFTPHGAPTIWGVQGRYFAPVLPLLAITVAALTDRSPSQRTTAALAITLALLSGFASIDAVLSTDWDF